MKQGNKTEKIQFYQMFFRMYVVLVLQNVISLSVNLADNIMLGAYSETALSGVAAVNQIQFIFQQLLTAIGEGTVILSSQYWGKGQTEPMKKIASAAMRLSLFFSIILFILVSIFPEEVMGLFTSDAEIIHQGTEYLAMIRFTYVFFAVSMTLLAAMRSVETVNIAFYLSVVTLLINCCINYLLIYGKFGAPRLGVTGAAIGTLTARVVECGTVIYYVWKKDTKLKIRLRDYLKTDWTLFGDYMKVTLPMLVVQGLWGVNTALQTAILGHMTAIAIAANSVASTLFMVVKSTASGAASTASVIIGKAIGMGDMDRVKAYSRRLQKMFLVIGILSGIFLFFIRIPVLGLYDLSQETREMADTFLLILSVVCVTMSYQMPVNNGIIRGGGSAVFVVKMDLISIWLIVIPLSFFMAFVVKAAPAAVVCCLNADQVFKCIPAFIKVNFGHWARKLTRG